MSYPSHRTLSFELMPPRPPRATQPPSTEERAKYTPEQAAKTEAPPKVSSAPPNSFWDTVEGLLSVRPDYVSLTSGAGGGDREVGADVLRQLVGKTDASPLAHLTCVNTPLNQLRQRVESIMNLGVSSFLALRGDPPEGSTSQTSQIPAGSNDYVHSAVELVALLRQIEAERNDAGGTSEPTRLSISVAAFPSGNPVANTCIQKESQRLLEKQEAGADFAITQLFWSPRQYEEFVAEAHRQGVTIPIVPGLLPPTQLRRVRRLQQLTGIEPPPELVRALETADDDEDAHRRGIAYIAKVAGDVLDQDPPGLHIFTFNQARPALDLVGAVNAIANPAH